SGGVLGHQVRLVTEDDGSRTEGSATALDRVLRKGVSAVIGSPLPGAAQSVMARVEDAKVPYLSLSPGGDNATSYMFGVPASPAPYAGVALRYFHATGAAHLMLAYVGGDPIGMAGQRAAERLAQENGVALVGATELTGDAVEFSALFDGISRTGADAVL